MDRPTQPIHRIVRERPHPGDHVPVLHVMEAVRSFCSQCLETADDVRDCCATTCSLWPYRYGKGYQVAHREGLTVDPNSPPGARPARPVPAGRDGMTSRRTAAATRASRR